MNEKIKDVLDRLSKSKFRSGFHLKDKDMLYIKDKGVDKIREHAYDFISKRIVDTSNVTDGKQRTSCFYCTTCYWYLLQRMLRKMASYK